MAEPNLGTLEFHASGKVAGSSGALSDATNVSGVVRNGTGDYTVTLGTAIDPTQRRISVTPRQAAPGHVQYNPAGDTATAFQVLGFDLATPSAADVDFEFSVERSKIS